jgi:hypothetical protein
MAYVRRSDVWITVFVGYYQGERVQQWHDSQGGLVMISAMAVLGVVALIQLLALPLFRTTASHATFRLAVVNAKGECADRSNLLVRWTIVWFPLFFPMLFVALLINGAELTAAFISALALLLLWISAAVYAALHPHRGLHDRLAGTWVVRR